MSGQLTVTATTLPGGVKKYSLCTQSLEDGKRRATGGCQLREREGHHPLREEQHDCLRLPGLHGDQPSTSRRKEELKALRCLAVAWRVSTLGSERESVLHQKRTANVSHMFYCQYCITPSLQNIGGGTKLQYQAKRLQMKASVYVRRCHILYLNCFFKTLLNWMHKKEGQVLCLLKKPYNSLATYQ